MDQSEIEHQLNFLMNNNKQYVAGNTYNGVALTVTGTNWTTVFAWFRPLKLINAGTKIATYILECNIFGGVSSASRSSYQVTISGVTFYSSTTTEYQNISASNMDSGITSYSMYATPNTGSITIQHASATTTLYNFSFKCALKNKPTWMD